MTLPINKTLSQSTRVETPSIQDLHRSFTPSFPQPGTSSWSPMHIHILQASRKSAELSGLNRQIRSMSSKSAEEKVKGGPSRPPGRHPDYFGMFAGFVIVGAGVVPIVWR